MCARVCVCVRVRVCVRVCVRARVRVRVRVRVRATDVLFVGQVAPIVRGTMWKAGEMDNCVMAR